MKILIHLPLLRLASLMAVLLTVLAGALPASAQIPAPRQDQPVALTGGNIYLHDGSMLEGGTILFDQGKIVAIGTAVTIPQGTEIIDIRGKYVYPGLILARTSLGLSEIGRLSETTDMSELGNINPNVRVQVAFHPASEHIGVAAIHGITTIVPTPTGGLISGQAAAMVSDGWTWEQMVLKAPVGMSLNWPAMRSEEARQKAISELNEAFDSARRYLLAKRAAEKNGQSNHITDIRWEAMIPVLDKELPVFMSANDITHIQEAILWAEKQQVNMVLSGGRDAGYVSNQLKSRNIPVMLTPVIGGPSRQWEAYDQAYATAKQLHDAGVTFCIAGEASAAGAYRLAHHAAAAVAFGLPQQAALDAITIQAAKLLGIDGFTGSIEAGKDASLIVTDGNPLELWTKTEMVFIQGRRIDNTDKHKRLYERYLIRHQQENR